MNLSRYRRRRATSTNLDGRVVLITGAARGIGAATAAAFSRSGANVWLADIDDEVATETATSIPNARVVHLDVTDHRSWAAALGHIGACVQGVDVLVNNAGVMPLGPFLDEVDATTNMTLDVNVRGVLYGMRAVLPVMMEARSGHIVNVASMAAQIPLPGMVTYNASKFASLGASLAAREEYRLTGVDVCAVLPSAVRTELSSGVTLGRGMPTVDPEDVADAIVGTLRSRAAVTSVPSWVSPSWTIIDAVTPARLERVVRTLIDDRRALKINYSARATYDHRLHRHSTQNDVPDPPTILGQ